MYCMGILVCYVYTDLPGGPEQAACYPGLLLESVYSQSPVIITHPTALGLPVKIQTQAIWSLREWITPGRWITCSRRVSLMP